MPEWKDLLLPASGGERPIIDGGRTPVAYSMCVTLYNYLPMVQARRSVTLICYSSSLPSTARFGLSLHDNPKRRSRKVAHVRILGTW